MDEKHGRGIAVGAVAGAGARQDMTANALCVPTHRRFHVSCRILTALGSLFKQHRLHVIIPMHSWSDGSAAVV